MKNAFLAGVALTVLALGTSAMASEKVCYGSTKSDDTKGAVLNVSVSSTKITIKTVTVAPSGSSEGYNGTYPREKDEDVNGRDGKTYLGYKGEDSDYQDIILVDKGLLKTGGKGLLQIRARGEGFFNSVYVCKDDN